MIKNPYEKAMSYASPDEKIRMLFWRPKRKKYFESLIDQGKSFMFSFREASEASNELLLDFDKGCMEQTKK